MCTRQQAIGILGEVFDQCQKRFPCPVEDAYLYGSYARGDYRSDSDVDILLTVPSADLAPLRKAAAAVSSELSLKHDVTVSVSIQSASQFMAYRDALPYYQNILREGIRYVH